MALVKNSNNTKVNIQEVINLNRQALDKNWKYGEHSISQNSSDNLSSYI